MHLAIAEDEIQLWQTSLTPPPTRLAALAATLNDHERERANRFRWPEQRDRFIAGRGWLREVLGTCLDHPPEALQFSHGLQGKPILAGTAARTGLHFNLSHSGDRALCAVARREVGVDLETLDRRVDYAAVAQRICSLREWAIFQSLPSTETKAAFFACWTRKEAVAKAIGQGLATGMNTLEVYFGQDATDRPVCLRDTAGRLWTVLNLPLELGWCGALAAVGTDWRLTRLKQLRTPSG